MKTRTILSGLMLLSLFCATTIPARAQTSNSQQTLNQYVADLQSSPNDAALRGKIIALAQTMDPPPDVPAEARRHMARGVAAVEDAKTPDDFKDACNEFQQAASLAPWLANAYRNLAIAQDKAGMYNESLASLRLYMLTKPSSADADWANDLKAKVEYRKEKAAKAKEEENSPQAVAAREQQSFQDLLRKIDGRRYTAPTAPDMAYIPVIDIKSRLFVYGLIGQPCCQVLQGYQSVKSIEIQGRITNHASNGLTSRQWTGVMPCEETYTISDAGDTITYQENCGNGWRVTNAVYNWQR